MKRQASRFCVYEYDDNGVVKQEITDAEADLTWIVHLVNKKASWHEFRGGDTERKSQRNAHVVDRSKLEIDPGERKISGRSAGPVLFDTGTFGPVPLDGDGRESERVKVPLGELRTDEKGRLLVLGGFGSSRSLKPGQPITEFANNDYWYDDTSDGLVRVSIRLKGTEHAVADSEIDPAWVIVAPPDFAPGLRNLVTLYDVAEQVAIDEGWIPATPTPVSFFSHVYPIFARVAGYAWVNVNAQRGHGPYGAIDFLAPGELHATPLDPRVAPPDSPAVPPDPSMLERLASKDPKDEPLHRRVFNRIRKPPGRAKEDEQYAQATPKFMPAISGDEGDAKIGHPDRWFTVTREQYGRLERWALGDFNSDLPSPIPEAPEDVDSMPLAEQPKALDRAALEATVGGPFFPGIEMTFIARLSKTWREPGFRLSASLNPGDITRWMAVPWQADFYQCRDHWWPAHRPDDVVTEKDFADAQQAWTEGAGPFARLLAGRERWDRGLSENPPDPPGPLECDSEMPEVRGPSAGDEPGPSMAGDEDMVRLWSRLGFVVRKMAPDQRYVYVETERDEYAGMDVRNYFHYLLNIDQYPEFEDRRLRELIKDFLDHARALQKDPNFKKEHPELVFFPYTPAVFDQRLWEIYEKNVEAAANYNPATDPYFWNRDDEIVRLKQLAPFNQLDGAWLRDVARAGPSDDVHEKLFKIWRDEEGNALPEFNHANIYTDLLHSVGVYFPDITSMAYAHNPDLLDSAFTNPVFQLAISRYSHEYFEEILGMTLWLEWDVVELKSTVDRLRYFGIDASFYVLHVGIDNAVNGHGALAKQAVELYLDGVYQREGKDAMDEAWERIWTGFVSFKNTGTLEADLKALLERRHHQQLADQRGVLKQRMIDMIVRKRPVGSVNHRTRQLGPLLINDWFDFPEQFLCELIKAGWVIPGEPDASPIFERMGMTGPMLAVFSDEEQQLWRDWIRSLKDPPAAPGTLVVEVVKVMAERQQGTIGHGARLLGPDPAAPGQKTWKTIDAWFGEGPGALLSALADPENGWVIPRDSKRSPLVQYLAGGDHPMARELQRIMPNAGGKTYARVLAEWVESGCPPPPAPGAAVPPAVGPAGIGVRAPRPRRRSWGQGHVH